MRVSKWRRPSQTRTRTALWIGLFTVSFTYCGGDGDGGDLVVGGGSGVVVVVMLMVTWWWGGSGVVVEVWW